MMQVLPGGGLGAIRSTSSIRPLFSLPSLQHARPCCSPWTRRCRLCPSMRSTSSCSRRLPTSVTGPSPSGGTQIVASRSLKRLRDLAGTSQRTSCPPHRRPSSTLRSLRRWCPPSAPSAMAYQIWGCHRRSGRATPRRETAPMGTWMASSCRTWTATSCRACRSSRRCTTQVSGSTWATGGIHSRLREQTPLRRVTCRMVWLQPRLLQGRLRPSRPARRRSRLSPTAQQRTASTLRRESVPRKAGEAKAVAARAVRRKRRNADQQVQAAAVAQQQGPRPRERQEPGAGRLLEAKWQKARTPGMRHRQSTLR
mmetsp:Transcript_210/g.486  ORF Transcript_210/g.486 Transcript_210/m.486 type:complete len:311 (-) Transcript_210:1080-2012(-)